MLIISLTSLGEIFSVVRAGDNSHIRFAFSSHVLGSSVCPSVYIWILLLETHHNYRNNDDERSCWNRIAKPPLQTELYIYVSNITLSTTASWHRWPDSRKPVGGAEPRRWRGTRKGARLTSSLLLYWRANLQSLQRSLRCQRRANVELRDRKITSFRCLRFAQVSKSFGAGNKVWLKKPHVAATPATSKK